MGDTLLIGGKPFQIVGIYETGSLLIDTTIVMEITTARELLKLDKHYVSVMYVEPEPLVDLDDLADRIRDALPEVQVRSMSQFNLQVGNIMGKLDLFLLLTVGLALLVGGVGIANTMLMSAMERIVDFGVMRANGWTRRNILGLVTAESSLLGPAFRPGGQRPGVRRNRASQLSAHALRAQAGSDARAGRREHRHGDRDRDAGRLVPGLARFPHDPDGCHPQ